MPTTLGIEFGPDFRGRPTHMSEEDVALWWRWWPTVRDRARRAWFDVGLGMPASLPGTGDVNQLAGWIRVNQKRADAVIETESELWIVELRHLATLNAIGRLEGYGMLWADDPRSEKRVKLVLVTDRDDSETSRLAAAQGIEFVVV